MQVTSTQQTPQTVAAALTEQAGNPNRVIYAELVYTDRQPQGSSVPAGEYRLTDVAWSAMRHIGSPLYVADDSPSIKLNVANRAPLDQLIVDFRDNHPSGRPADAGFNAAIVAVEGVLNLGAGLHDHSMDVTSITALDPTSLADLRRSAKG